MKQSTRRRIDHDKSRITIIPFQKRILERSVKKFRWFSGSVISQPQIKLLIIQMRASYMFDWHNEVDFEDRYGKKVRNWVSRRWSLNFLMDHIGIVFLDVIIVIILLIISHRGILTIFSVSSTKPVNFKILWFLFGLTICGKVVAIWVKNNPPLYRNV